MVDGSATNAIAVGQFALRVVLRHVDDEGEAVVGNHIHHLVRTVLVGPTDGFSLHAVVVEELRRACRRVDFVALLFQAFRRVEQADLALRRARGNEDAVASRWQRVARRNERVEQGFVEAVAEASDLARR